MMNARPELADMYGSTDTAPFPLFYDSVCDDFSGINNDKLSSWVEEGILTEKESEKILSIMNDIDKWSEMSDHKDELKNCPWTSAAAGIWRILFLETVPGSKNLRCFNKYLIIIKQNRNTP